MVGGVKGGAGGILGLREFIAGHEEAITADLLDRGLHVSDIGNVWSWFEFRCWLKYLPATSAVVRLRQERAALEAIPEEQRTVGSDAVTFAEMDAFLGWD